MFQVSIVGIDELAARVPDGASLSVHKGDERDVPMALAHALIRRGVRGLHLITLPTAAYPASGMMVDLLIGAGCVDSVETSGISLHELGAAPRFTQAVKAGRLKVVDATCPAVYAGLQAGAKGQPFAPLRGLIGSDLLRHRSDYRVIDNPFAPGDAIVVVPAINADMAMFHADRADAEGNVWIGRDRDRLLAAHAANRVLVTVDQVVPVCFFDDEVRAAGVIPASCIDAIAVVPGAGLPLTADGQLDLAEVRRYQRAAQDDAGFNDYLRTQVYARLPQAA
ncbi:MAG: CoA synthetase [Burkholderiaceae bacterium]|nr:CoA synthetase [Burkholderiaceae bacterium]